MPRTSKKSAKAVAADVAAALPQPVAVPALPETTSNAVAAKTRISSVLLPQVFGLFRRLAGISEDQPVDGVMITVNIETPEAFAQADADLAAATVLEKAVESDADEILKPLNQARTAVLNQKSTAMKPLNRLMLALREGMEGYKRRERAEQLRIEEERARVAREAEWQRQAKEQEAERLRQQEANAKTEQMREFLRKQRESAQDQAKQAEDVVDTVTAAPLPPVAEVAHSTTRTVMNYRVTDKLAFLKAVAAGEVPDVFVEVVDQAVRSALRMNEPLVRTWPGIEVFEGVQIVRK